MNAHAGQCAPRDRERPASTFPFGRLVPAFAATAALCAAQPAHAGIGAVASIFSDSRFRGLSVSGGDPVGLLDLSYDDPGGAYFGASGSVVATSGELRPLALQLNGGYAKSLSSGVNVDLGIAHSDYSHYSTTVGGSSYTEVYAGLSRKGLTGRLHVSPHYFEAGTWTLYGELDEDLALARKLSLNAHVGMLIPVRSRDSSEAHPRFDWQIGLNRQIGRLSLHAAWTGAGRVRHYKGRPVESRSALVFGLSWVL